MLRSIVQITKGRFRSRLYTGESSEAGGLPGCGDRVSRYGVGLVPSRLRFLLRKANTSMCLNMQQSVRRGGPTAPYFKFDHALSRLCASREARV